MTNRSETPNLYQQVLDDTATKHQGTHYEGCWIAHHRCAIAEAARLQAALTAAQALAEQYRKVLEEFGMHKDNCAKNLDPFFEISCDLDAAIDRAKEG